MFGLGVSAAVPAAVSKNRANVPVHTFIGPGYYVVRVRNEKSAP